MSRILCLIICLTFYVGCYANPAEETEQLHKTKQQIAHLKKKLLFSKHEIKTMSQQLQDIETSIQEAALALHKQNANLDIKQKELNALMSQHQLLKDNQKTIQKKLSELIKAQYLLSKVPAMKLILSSNSTTYERTAYYYQQLQNAQHVPLKNIFQQLEQIKIIKSKIKQELAAMVQLKQQKALAVENLKSIYQKRSTLLDTFQKESIAQKKQLDLFEYDEKMLLQKLKRATKTASNDYFINMLYSQSEQLRSPLDMPLTTFVKTLQKEKSPFIKAQSGQPIYALYEGEVIFANWLKGFGLLLIIDHGDGYMSLYGHNQVIFKQAGDKIFAGDKIGLVGQSGGHLNAGLYFEIRKNGNPITL